MHGSGFRRVIGIQFRIERKYLIADAIECIETAKSFRYALSRNPVLQLFDKQKAAQRGVQLANELHAGQYWRFRPQHAAFKPDTAQGSSGSFKKCQDQAALKFLQVGIRRGAIDANFGSIVSEPSRVTGGTGQPDAGQRSARLRIGPWLTVGCKGRAAMREADRQCIGLFVRYESIAVEIIGAR